MSVEVHPIAAPWGRFALYSFLIDGPEPAIVDTGVTASAAGVPAALERLGAWRFDVIVSDWNMEPMDGVELLRRVRKNPATAHTPFILITASLSETAWRNAIEYGATDFLLKPLSLNSLRSACDIGTRLHAFDSGAVISLADRLRQRRFNV